MWGKEMQKAKKGDPLYLKGKQKRLEAKPFLSHYVVLLDLFKVHCPKTIAPNFPFTYLYLSKTLLCRSLLLQQETTHWDIGD